MKSGRRVAVMLLTGGFAALLVFVVLNLGQESDSDQRLVVVAARDLGAGEILTPDNVQLASRDVDLIPNGFLEDMMELASGQYALSTPRLAGETIATRHLGAPIQLAPYERGIALPVFDVNAAAGLLHPGQLVSVIGTLTIEDNQGDITYAKILFEDLRLLYISPEFQRTLVQKSGDLLTDEQQRANEADSNGIVIVAASVYPAALVYETQSKLAHDAFARTAAEAGLTISEDGTDGPINPYVATPPTVVWGTQLEVLATLATAGANFLLVLQPQDLSKKVTVTTPGYSTTQMILPILKSEQEVAELYGIDESLLRR